jgi:3-phosphoshikimate 1-carboxyvinyltransferase
VRPAGGRPVVGIPGVDFSVEDVQGTFPEELEIRPLDRPVDATARIPGSKSVTNRALIVAALADGVSVIRNPLFSDDSYWLMRALVQLGFSVHADREAATVTVEGRNGMIPARDVEVFVGNAGTVARFLPPALALGPGPYHVDGVPRMRERPVRDLVEALRQLGAKIDYAGDEGAFPITIRGGGIAGGTTQVEGGKSSQFLSGILIAAPYARHDVTLKVAGDLVSRPYIGITLDVMEAFGVEVQTGSGYGEFSISPGFYRRREYTVEPDASAASYFMAAAAVTTGRVKIPGLGAGSAQGDLEFAGVLRRMGCAVDIGEDYVEVRGPRRLRGVEVDMNEFSDTMMTLAAIASFAEGYTLITNVEHTRHQETDRVSAVAAELRRLGVEVEERSDSLCITPGAVRPALIETYGDHRMAMAFAVTGLAAPGIRIKDPGCVTKTFPDYFRQLESLR